MTPKSWRQWHRWVAFPAALFLLWAGTTGIVTAATEFFGADEAKREALRTVVSQVTAGGVPIDKVTLELKGDQPTVTVFTGKPSGGEDRKFVVDANSGRVRSVEAYADKPLLYRLHSGEAFGDGGLVMAMGWGGVLVWLTLSGLVIYWRMRRREASGWQRVFW